MKLSLQVGRALFGLGFATVAGVCAFAQSQPMNDADATAPEVARTRLEIATVPAVTVPAAKETPRWVVASVRVGTPEQAPAEPARHVAVRLRASGDSQG
jgi:hypothetical protein